MTAHNGGYLYGEEVGPREFTLSCYFEDLRTEEIESAVGWFYRGRTGELVFDDRPFVVYTATVSSAVEGTLYNGKDATLTIKMMAYDPFGKMTKKELDGMDEDGSTLYSGIVPKESMPTPPTAPGDYLLYNPGTEMADTVITIAGTAPNGVIIENRTTGDICKFLTIPASPDSLVIDSETGDVYLGSDPDGHCFEAHDEGYIRLAPCTPYQRGVLIQHTEGSNYVSVASGYVTKGMIGQYLLLGGTWYRIISVSGYNTLVLNRNVSTTGSDLCMIATMNEITITAEGAEFTTLDITYTPRIR